MLLQKLKKKELIHPPSFVPDNTMYLTVMGSTAYGVNEDDSDWDIYGFCIPKKEDVFPHLQGEIPMFGRQKKRFEQWQEHHVYDPTAMNNAGRNYDFNVFNIVKYFSLVMQNNPNVLESLYTPQTCVIHSTPVAELVRENRKMFLHKGCWHRYRGYAFQQMHKMEIKNPEGKRKELVEEYGLDTKFAYHVVRLIGYCEQILTEHDLDLQRDKERLKAIRRGEWNIRQIKEFFESKEKSLDKLYNESKLPYGPDEEKIKALLLKCLEMHYGSLKDCVVVQNRHELACKEIREVLEKYNV